MAYSSFKEAPITAHFSSCLSACFQRWDARYLAADIIVRARGRRPSESTEESEKGWENDDLQLLNLKRLGHTSPKYRDYLRTQQDTADNAGPDLQLVWLKKMKKIMNQIDK
ncbi:hypothetical protein F5890DRAFT_1472930 [Lentinula detonsa]|uniref:Uncharacterized protein n=1 Tax=Lentinula detonsa TaxID=2804962 RepID=A0AA38Q430_9AGAR|nr:hypothetical protein F5890DRAFT_1472930 [Lentinula detonsa]